MSITTSAREKISIRAQLESIGARRVLEIGAFEGETTRVLCEAVLPRNGQVVVIDPMRWSSELFRNGILRHVERAMPAFFTALEAKLTAATYEDVFWRNVGVHRKRVILHRALSCDERLLASRAPELRDFDAVFIDGDHSYLGARTDLEQWGSRVRDGGLVLVHDAIPRFPGVLRAIDEWSARMPVEIEWPVDSLCTLRVKQVRSKVA
jgi:predicted O-methyltransferase YrrM